jgi:hypothetical protein
MWLAKCGLRQIIVKLWKVFTDLSRPGVGSVGSTENVQTLFEHLPCSVEHVRWNSFHTFIAYIRSATSLAIMDAPSF